MSFAFPAGLALSALALPLVLLYVLKLRRKPVTVSSTLLWQRVVEDRRANAPWERLRRHLLLLLQLLALALLVLAFAGPYRQASVTLAADTVIVLDGSASMLALREGGDTRFEAARAEIGELLEAVEPSRRASLVLAGPQPQVLSPLSGDAARLRRALAGATPAEAPCDLPAALDLARTLVRGRSGGEVVLVTDGAFDGDLQTLSLLRGVRLVNVGDPVPNLGLVSVAIRRLPGAAGAQEIFAGIAASGGATRSATLLLEILGGEGDWTEATRTAVVLEPGERLGKLFRVEALPGTRLRLRIESDAADSLAVDDEALLVVPPPPDVRVLLVSRSPWLLSRALAAVPGVQVFRSEGLPDDAASYDLVVLDGLVPEVPPAAPLLVFGAGPPNGGGPLAATGSSTRPRVLRWERRHPALRHVDLGAVLVERSWTIEPPPEAQLLIEGDSGPLAAAWTGPGGPVLQFSFDLLASDLPLRVAFPVLVHDAVDWLTARHAEAAVLAAGQAQDLRLGETAGTTTWRDPQGVERELRSRSGSVRLPAAREIGLHRLSWTPAEPPGSEARERLVPVALLSADETAIEPRFDGSALVEDALSAGEAAERVPGRHFLWPWLAAFGIVVALVEWTVHHRRPG
jgi:hypothetical protein